MSGNKDCSQIIKREVTKKSIPSDNDDISVECDSLDHQNDNIIREGNRVYLVITRDGTSWNVENTICMRCSVRDAVERLSADEKDLAVVETTVSIDVDNEQITFNEPKIWELMKVE